MSQAIAYVIYGLPIANHNNERTDEQEELIERQPHGVIKKYSGNGTHNYSAAFGIQIGQISEGDHHDEIGNLHITVQAKELAMYGRLWLGLTPEDQQTLSDDLGDPRVFILWGSS
jgi:hypothetical protein